MSWGYFIVSLVGPLFCWPIPFFGCFFVDFPAKAKTLAAAYSIS